MLTADHNTHQPMIMALPLVKLADPAHVIPTLRFVASDAAPCVAEALMDCLITNYMPHSGRDRSSATRFLHELIGGATQAPHT